MSDLALSAKELVILVAIAAIIFALARPVMLSFTSPEDYARRRNTWLLLTAAAFLLPSFWLYVGVAIPILLINGRRDACPAALYVLLLHVIPPFSNRVPMVGISYLIDLDNYRLISLFVLGPLALQLWHTRGGRPRPATVRVMDFCLLAYCIIQGIFYIRPENSDLSIAAATATDSLRRMVEFLISNGLPYYVISRACANRRAMLDVMATFTLVCALMATIALFESAKHWLLYNEVMPRWGVFGRITLYVSRNNSLRAIASAGDSLTLGYLLAMGFGFWLCLRDYVSARPMRTAGTVLLWLGLLASYARGPWICAVFLYFAFAMLRPEGASSGLKALGVAAFVAVVVSLTPLRDRIVSVMPFLGGKVDYGNVLYRQALVQRSWELIRANWLLGDQLAITRLQDLRQGQGIIDIVNTYVEVTLASGLVGLSLFVTFIAAAAIKLWRISRRLARRDRALNLLGASLLGCILATLLMIEDTSFRTGVEALFYVLAGLAAAYVRFAMAEVKAVAPQAQPVRGRPAGPLIPRPRPALLTRSAHRLH